MTIRVALHHETEYRYDRPVKLSPHVIRLRPAAHSRTPVHSYSLKIEPADHFINWQQDPFGNYLARLVFPEPARKLSVEVDVIAEMTTINPFDFFVDHRVDELGFSYPSEYRSELGSFLTLDDPSVATGPSAPWTKPWRSSRILFQASTTAVCTTTRSRTTWRPWRI